ncbi:hypothetical protein B4U37_16665 [Sutcliffiella horikoshii]|uniref:Uncharacterized protein n=1 Tax=Sutcliffiella horikoshii TaxID=79883 RepID=A0ABN4ZKR3_9BACI|nr:hypothetical protein [Sutcliffiella horikoshii]ART77586.1 hypothetical protein B4U37_16665 [Sutcliffiella horikoshii]
MYWKLRVPLLLGIIGVISGLVQKFPTLLVNTSNLLSNAVFIGLIGIIFTILERSNVNDKKAHFTIGVAIIIFGIVFDFLTA